MRIMDLQINLDGLIMRDDESVDDLIAEIKKLVNTSWDINYIVMYEEEIDE